MLSNLPDGVTQAMCDGLPEYTAEELELLERQERYLDELLADEFSPEEWYRRCQEYVSA